MFDRSLPFETVIGISGVNYMQHGRYYRVDGTHMVLQGSCGVPAPEPEPEAEAAPVAKKAGRPKNIENQSDAELQAQMAVYGEEWRGREAAVSFLKAYAG